MLVNVHRPGTNTNGYGAKITGGSGTHPYGLVVEDAGATFDMKVYLSSSTTAGSVLETDNRTSGTASAPNDIVFSRTGNQEAKISGTAAAGDFSSGVLTLATRVSGTMTDVLTSTSGVVRFPQGRVRVTSLPSYADNVAALAGGLSAGDLYQVSGTNPRQIAVVF